LVPVVRIERTTSALSRRRSDEAPAQQGGRAKDAHLAAADAN